MNTLGIVHVVFGMLALLAGTAVVLIRKGTRSHRTLGHVYLTTMLGLNVTALFIYDLYGHFGPFHWMALGSLLTLAAGMVPVLTRRPKGRWLSLHAAFISGSFVGLVAAFAAEIMTRIPGTEDSFGLVVGLTSAAIIGIGAETMRRRMPQSIGRTPAHLRRPGASNAENRIGEESATPQ